MPPARSPSKSDRRAGRTGRLLRIASLAAIPLVVLAVPSLARLPARLLAGCPAWIALAVLLELTSILGFIACYALVFGHGMNGRQSAAAALRALGASSVLPAGGLVGPALGAGSTSRHSDRHTPVIRSTIAFAILTALPNVAALALFGSGLWLGWPAGPHRAVTTIPLAAAGVVLLVLFWRFVRRPGPGASPRRRGPRWQQALSRGARELCAGATEAGRFLSTRDWRLVGSVGYYAFDNAVLWAAFHAYGSAPPLGAIVMGYLVGSLATAIPIPGGLGVAEGGLVGALAVYGAPAAPAVGAVVLYRGVSVGLSALLGSAAWMVRARARNGTSIPPRNDVHPRGRAGVPSLPGR